MMLETVLLLVFSFLLGMGCLIVAGWLVISHQFATLDGIFLTLVCLVLALVFFLNCGWTLRSEEFRQLMQSRGKQ
ncbi:MAG: hypothetical protein L0387_09640 [Acidobacteria bacterium]|nr:hypothetical protein [Acidobacteriota bacterium]